MRSTSALFPLWRSSAHHLTGGLVAPSHWLDLEGPLSTSAKAQVISLLGSETQIVFQLEYDALCTAFGRSSGCAAARHAQGFPTHGVSVSDLLSRWLNGEFEVG
jgi:hypothetical protein